MIVQGQRYRTVWDQETGAGWVVKMIDQRRLPHEFRVVELRSCLEVAQAIRNMTIRGAPAIGAAGAYGFALAAAQAPAGGEADEFLIQADQTLRSTRPTAYDLFYTLDRVKSAIEGLSGDDRQRAALAEARRLAEESVERCRRIGEHGRDLIPPGGGVLTHCNAGWLATVDWGTALSPIYHARREGRGFKVLIDETRPRLQGANLTAWELAQESVPCEIIADNAAGLLMRRGEVRLVITGADRIAANGDTANKIGTYEKALLAREHGIPFYMAAPASTFDLDCRSGDEIPIEERSADELLYAYGRMDSGELGRVRLAPEGVAARNPAFDVTPAALITGFITEAGIIAANADSIARAWGKGPTKTPA
jgi:S-methyl-5-thioribose-1-phosphate isomerase